MKNSKISKVKKVVKSKASEVKNGASSVVSKVAKKAGAKKPAAEKTSQIVKITNQTLETEREEVLKNARKFKYPVQYSKNRLVTVAAIISGAVAVLGLAFVLFQLYAAQNTGRLIYQITRFVPFEVAKVDGAGVRYSDYLVEYRSNKKWSEENQNKAEFAGSQEDQLLQYKNKAMDNAIKNAYALKIAKENGIEVSDEEVESYISQHRVVNGSEMSEERFYDNVRKSFGLSKSEYNRLFVTLPLYRSKVSAFLDEEATKIRDEVAAELKKNNGNFDEIAKKFGNKVTVGKVNKVFHWNKDGGRAATAAAQEVGKFSEGFVSTSGSGYYFVKTLAKTEREVDYQFIEIKFTAFEQKITELKEAEKISEFIKIEGR